MGRIKYDIDTFIRGIKSKNRRILSKALSLTENTKPEDKKLAYRLLDVLYKDTGKSFRIGITGPPGVGKSSFIEALGTHITEDLQKEVAVIAIDPSSVKTGGSILGDRTRMQKLSGNPRAFIRPAPTRGNIGGVAESTLFMLLIFEAAGYEYIFIETVGVGQNEYEVRNMTDLFLLLLQAGAGDSIQGIKRGIMEMADMFLVTKADGQTKHLAELTRKMYRQALMLFPPLEHGISQEILLTSIYDKKSVEKVWRKMLEFYHRLKSSGYLENLRKKQTSEWIKSQIQYKVLRYFYEKPKVREFLEELLRKTEAGEISPFTASEELLVKTGFFSE